jgi:inner membrane protein
MVEGKDGYYLGYYSLLDDNHNIDFHYIPKNHELLSEVPENKKLSTLLHITDGYYCLEKIDNRLLLHDLRFGQATDFATGKGDFIFTFYLDKKNTGNEPHLEIIQKQMDFNDIKGEMFVMLWKRILGVKKF